MCISGVCHVIERRAYLKVAERLTGKGFPDLPEDAAFGKIYVRIGEGEGELESLLETFRSKSVIVKNEITTKPWGLKDFTIIGKSLHESHSSRVSDLTQTWTE